MVFSLLLQSHLYLCNLSSCCKSRFPPESNIGANKGLDVARKLLEPIKEQNPWISYSDLWTLAGAVAIEEMGGAPFWKPLDSSCDATRVTLHTYNTQARNSLQTEYALDCFCDVFCSALLYRACGMLALAS